MIDAVTKRWLRTPDDECAAASGCKMDEERGRHVLAFMRKFLRLYEGDWAGQAFKPMAWQEDFLMRLFGWIRFSERHKRWVRRFRQASLWVPKKNGKSPLLAALGLYLLCADGEQGQKVYFGAKDGQQAREIAGKHAIEMVLSSPELMAECDINKSLMQITHKPTRSILKPISSGDARTQKSKEGLNGSILIDETHVVDRDFVGRISRAGISRSEPLQIEVSTAGDDPDGYGRERYDYAKTVLREGGNEQLLVVCYEAPQDLTDEQLDADPVKYGQAANPSWGQTIDPAEYLADCSASKRSLLERARFKMYRLNIWQQSSTPWLDLGDWAQCRREYKESDLLGRSCFGAFDLSRTRDTTAITLVFPWEDGTFRQWSYFWLPRDRVDVLASKVPYQQWEKDGWLSVTEGDQVDYAFVRKKIIEVFGKFCIQKLLYDDTYAAQMVQRLIEEDGLPYDVFEAFKQALLPFTAATVAYADMVHTGTIHHPGNPLLTWQAGNVMVRPDANDNIRPLKQKQYPYKTIDGIVSGIMAVSPTLQSPIGAPTVTVL